MSSPTTLHLIIAARDLAAIQLNIVRVQSEFQLTDERSSALITGTVEKIEMVLDHLYNRVYSEVTELIGQYGLRVIASESKETKPTSPG